MRTAGVTVLAVVGGLLAGLVLSEIIGIVGSLRDEDDGGCRRLHG
jgi:Family of unknown function (DUF5957)